MEKEIRWAILGTGAAAREMAEAMREAGREIYAVGNRTRERAEEFGKKYGVRRVYGDLHEMLQDSGVDVVYVATPHNTHFGFIKEALANQKHVLCEKAITLNSAELKTVSVMAKEKRLVLAEAMTIYHMPLYKELRKRIDQGEIGEIRMIQANFGSLKEYDPENRFFSKKLAGGAMLDIGVYALSLARFFMKSGPDKAVSSVRLAPTGVDEASGIVITNPDGQMAVISLSLHMKQPKRGVICGEKGYIEIMEYPRAQEAVIVDAGSGERRVIRAGETGRALRYELEDMENAIRGGQSGLLLDYTQDVMELMTRLRREWGVSYPEEEAALW